MEIVKNVTGTEMTLALVGRLDSVTAPMFEEQLKLEGINSLILDLSELEYISSAGLRVILSAQKQMNVQGKMVVKNPCEVVEDVLVITGFADILTIEKDS